MSRKGETKTFTWPWIICAWLTPLWFGLICAHVILANLQSGQEARAKAAVARPSAYADALKSQIASDEALITISGYEAPKLVLESYKSAEVEPLPKTEGELSPVQKKWHDFAEGMRNDASYGIAAMRAHQDRMRKWSGVLTNNMNFKLYNHYLSISAAAARADVGEGVKVLKRDKTASAAAADAPALEGAEKKAATGAGAVDAAAPAGNASLLEVAEFQRNLIVALSALTGELANQGTTRYGYFKKYEDRRDNSSKAAADTVLDVQARQKQATAVIDAAAKLAVERKRSLEGAEAKLRDINKDPDVAGNLVADLQEIAAYYENEVITHTNDRQDFLALLQKNKKEGTGTQSLLTTATKPDAHITLVDRNAGICHIDLGSADNIVAGMRFEIWQVGGRGDDHRKSMVEVVRTLSSSFSLCTILETLDAGDPVRDGDAAINILWENGKYLNVALEGKLWTNEYTHYLKHRLRDILTNMGVPVTDELKPNSDLVILGGSERAGFGDDKPYKDLSKSIRVDTYYEERIRLYVDPR